jgi:hypothetical protein
VQDGNLNGVMSFAHLICYVLLFVFANLMLNSAKYNMFYNRIRVRYTKVTIGNNENLDRNYYKVRKTSLAIGGMELFATSWVLVPTS